MTTKRPGTLRFVYRCLRWPLVRALRLPGRLQTSFVESGFWRPVRRRLIAWRYSVQQTPVILERLDAIEARYWDHVALTRRVATLEEHLERLLTERDALLAHAPQLAAERDGERCAIRQAALSAPTIHRAAS